MRRLFLLTAFIFATIFSASAQTTDRLPTTSAPVAGESLQKGNWMMGGSLGSLGLDFANGNYNLNIFPTAGYFISDQAVLGAQTSLSFYSYEEGGRGVSYGFSPFVRYYLAAGARDTGRFFGELGLGGAGSAIRDRDSAISYLLGLKVGYAHFVAQNVALETTAGYTFSEVDISTPYNVAGLNFTFGFQIYLQSRRNR